MKGSVSASLSCLSNCRLKRFHEKLRKIFRNTIAFRPCAHLFSHRPREAQRKSSAHLFSRHQTVRKGKFHKDDETWPCAKCACYQNSSKSLRS